MKPDLKIGDIVRLKSGGPNMTVVENFPNAGNVKCAWFPSCPNWTLNMQWIIVPSDSVEVIDG